VRGEIVGFNASGRELAFIHEAVGGFRHITSLSLANNAITTLPDALFRLSTLVDLDLSNNLLSGEVSYKFNDLVNLRTLRLDNNRLFAMTDLTSMPSLTFLTLAHNRFVGRVEKTLFSRTFWSVAQISLGGAGNNVCVDAALRRACIDCAGVPSCDDYAALVALHDAGWINPPFCISPRVSCDTARRVVGLDFTGLKIAGTVPYNMVNKLSELQSLNLAGCDIQGAVPFVRGLQNLQSVNISRNAFDDISGIDCAALVECDLSKNKVLCRVLDAIPACRQRCNVAADDCVSAVAEEACPAGECGIGEYAAGTDGGVAESAASFISRAVDSEDAGNAIRNSSSSSELAER
jgi:hypothetical protein